MGTGFSRGVAGWLGGGSGLEGFAEGTLGRDGREREGGRREVRRAGVGGEEGGRGRKLE